MGGFECSTHHRPDGRRLDLIAATGHDRHAADDYRQLADLGLRTVRDGVRWHLIEGEAGRYDWRSLAPMVAAAREAGVQVIWDLLHYGWPDWIDPWAADFPERFAAFAGEAAAQIGAGGCYVPVNEISFLSWAGGEVGCMDPFATGRGAELKRTLCRSAILAIDAIRKADPDATIVTAEPLIRVHPASDASADRTRAAALDVAQFEALDMLLGRRDPSLGGSEAHVDVVGVNYYPHNQWWPGEEPRTVPAAAQVPLATLLRAVSDRYGTKPVLIAETGCEDEGRAPWLRSVVAEADRACADGVRIVGICLYPVMDHPGWVDDRTCRNGLICGFSDPPRPIYAPLAAVIADRWRCRDPGRPRVMLLLRSAFLADYVVAGLALEGALAISASGKDDHAPCFDAAVVDLGLEHAELLETVDGLMLANIPVLLVGTANATVPASLRDHPVLLQPFASFQVVEALRDAGITGLLR